MAPRLELSPQQGLGACGDQFNLSSPALNLISSGLFNFGFWKVPDLRELCQEVEDMQLSGLPPLLVMFST